MNAQMHAVTNHAVRFRRCMCFITHNLVVLLEINGSFSVGIQTVTCLVRNSGIQEAEW